MNSSKNFLSTKLSTLIVLLILFGTFLVFSKAIYFDFTNWDDDYLVYQNKFVLAFAKDGFSAFLNLELLVRDPLSLISHAFTYKLWGLNPAPYHLINILLHIINTYLVYLFCRFLSSSVFVQLIVTFLFAFHPYHVESVAWVAERKDVLYSVFFLLGLIFYCRYIFSSRRLFLYVSLTLSFLSVLSKTAAVVFPIILFVIDYLLERKISKKTILEKVPFLFIMLIFGLIQILPSTLVALRPDVLEINVIRLENFQNFFEYSFFDRIFLVSYSYLSYFLGILFPAKLSVIHPYPFNISEYLPLKFYLSLALLIVFFVIIIILKRKNIITRQILFGLMFFSAAILLVVQIIPVKGVSLVAERYTYIASIGLFFAFATVVNNAITISYLKGRKFSNVFILGILTASILCFSVFITYKRIDVWQNSITLFSDVINKYPLVAAAYINRGNAKSDLNDLDGALKDLNTAVRYVPGNADSWYNRGCVKLKMKDNKGAILDFNKATHLRPRFVRAIINRGIAFSHIDSNNLSIKDFNYVLTFEKNNVYALYNKARIYYKLNDYRMSEASFNEVLKTDPSDAYSYFYLGMINKSNYSRSLDYFNKAISFHPWFSEAYFERGDLKKTIKDYYGALNDISLALETKMEEVKQSSLSQNSELRMPLINKDIDNRAFILYSRGRLNFHLTKYSDAVADFNKSLRLNGRDWDSYLYRGMAKVKLKQYNEAIEDLKYVLKLNPRKVDAYFEIGNASYLQNKYDSALLYYNKAIEINSDASILSNRGNVKFALKDLAGAASDFNEAIKLCDTIPDYYFNRGVAYFNLNRKADACKDFKKASSMGLKKAEVAVLNYCK